MLHEFVKGWMTSFVRRAWDILQNGIVDGEASRDQMVLFTTVLFQHLTNAENAALPHDLTSIIEAPPPNPWPFIAEAAEAVYLELDAPKDTEGEPPAKAQKT